MRILAIRGSDLASLAGPFAIELDHPPLDRTGLFAIAGPTGAGKSTLLDALCLALYDRVPRLEGSAGPPVGRADEDEAVRIRAHDVRGVLRRGAGSGFAEVDFAGRDGRRWRARWEVRRARNRPDGRVQEQQMSLVDAATGEPVGRTKTEVLEAIAERVGLSYEQFRRSALLAQGEFAAFLRAPSAGRAALLERLTGTELYGRVSVAAHERARAEAAELDGLAARAADTAPLTDDERSALETRRTQTAEGLAAARAAVEAARAAVDWHRARSRLARSLAEAETAGSGLEARWGEAGPRRDELETVRRAHALRSVVEGAELAAREAAEARRRAAAAEDAAQGAESALQAAGKALADAERGLEQAGESLEEARPGLDEAARLDAVIVAASHELESAEAAVEATRGRLEEAVERHRRAEVAVETAGARREADRAWLGEHRSLEPLADEWPRWRELLLRLARARRTREESAGELAALEGPLGEARADAAAALRADLTPGEPCPVCGALEHPWAGRGDRRGERTDWQALETRRAELEAASAAARQDAEDALAALAAPAAGAPGGVAALGGDPTEAAGRWRQAAEAWRERAAAVRQAEEELAGSRPRLAAAVAETDHARLALAAAETELDRRRAAHDQPAAARKALFDGVATAELRARLEGAVGEARRVASAARVRHGEAAVAAERARAKAEAAAAARDAAVDREAEARARRDARLAEAGLELDRVRTALARSEAWAEAEAAALERLREERRTAAAVLDERRARLAEHEATGAPAAPAEQAERVFGEASATADSRQRAWAEVEGALAEDDRRRDRAAALAEALAAQRARSELWGRLRELVGSHDGAKLRTFAQGLTLDALLAHANHHLADLARRYRLERVPGTDLELQVIDREMADEVRAVQSLSGGESFLVSLALALGLASLASSRVAVESLFVDEGFGSLDPDALDAALAGLDSLQALGRQVGVISHVPTMVERIGAQVRVEPRGGGRSAVRVIGAWPAASDPTG